LADRSIPDEDFYDGYPQIENGVGLLRSLQEELEIALKAEDGDKREYQVGIITGVLAADYMNRLMQKIRAKFPGLNYRVYPIVNHFFGEMITVSGLVTGRDIVNQLGDTELPPRLLIPSSMLRSEQDLFLDSMSLDDVSQKLNRPIGISMNDGVDLLDKILGR